MKYLFHLFSVPGRKQDLFVRHNIAVMLFLREVPRCPVLCQPRGCGQKGCGMPRPQPYHGMQRGSVLGSVGEVEF